MRQIYFLLPTSDMVELAEYLLMWKLLFTVLFVTIWSALVLVWMVVAQVLAQRLLKQYVKLGITWAEKKSSGFLLLWLGLERGCLFITAHLPLLLLCWQVLHHGFSLDRLDRREVFILTFRGYTWEWIEPCAVICRESLLVEVVLRHFWCLMPCHHILLLLLFIFSIIKGPNRDVIVIRSWGLISHPYHSLKILPMSWLLLIFQLSIRGVSLTFSEGRGSLDLRWAIQASRRTEGLLEADALQIWIRHFIIFVFK